MPSYSESFGLVAIEAQAAGTPVLAAAVGGLPWPYGTDTPASSSRATTRRQRARARDFADHPHLADRMGRRRPARPVLRLGHRRATTADVYTAATQAHRRHVRSTHG
ncbi:hypothetical protein GCM10023238_24120 [Streptomyces heliomycini]